MGKGLSVGRMSLHFAFVWSPHDADLFIQHIAALHAVSDVIHRGITFLWDEYRYHCYAYFACLLAYILPWMGAKVTQMGCFIMSFETMQYVCGTSALYGVALALVFCKPMTRFLLTLIRNTALQYLETCQLNTDADDSSSNSPFVCEDEDLLKDLHEQPQGDHLLEFSQQEPNITPSSTDAESRCVGDLILLHDPECAVIGDLPRHCYLSGSGFVALLEVPETESSPVTSSPVHIKHCRSGRPLVPSAVGSFPCIQCTPGKPVPPRHNTLPVSRNRRSHFRSITTETGDRSTWVTFDHADGGPDTSHTSGIHGRLLDTAEKSSVTYVRYKTLSLGSSNVSLASVLTQAKRLLDSSYSKLDSSMEDDVKEDVIQEADEVLEPLNFCTTELQEKSWLELFGIREGLHWRLCNVHLLRDYLDVHILSKEGQLKRILHYPTRTLRLDAGASLKCGSRRSAGRRLRLHSAGQPAIRLRAFTHVHKLDLKRCLDQAVRRAKLCTGI
ncbi:uncharacterized protein LOC129593305 isoform X2 [Paramacrobiotus metropolitanus]|uniref:uncharacterized protein LOC129593305 isoform X2 n=1 Tax=Paramacrobiotus metropolitanus TaxID=2943436 RepID=UPI0024463AB4|nr:uncharacterized protein LOC129593305 isoform X2 [Paramacrobiotus metropolitanus]